MGGRRAYGCRNCAEQKRLHPTTPTAFHAYDPLARRCAVQTWPDNDMDIIRKAFCVAMIAATTGCASVDRPELAAGALPAEISAARGHTYSVDRMGDAIRAAKQSEGVTSVVLLTDQQSTVQDIIDVALVAQAASLPAFYRKDGKLSRIEVSR